MKKLALLLWLVTPLALSQTETFYVCEGGDGTLPETATCGTAYDAADFNVGANWDVDDQDDGKIGPNDLVALMDDGGDIRGTLTTQQPGLSAKPITIGIESGDSSVVSGSDLMATWIEHTGTTGDLASIDHEEGDLTDWTSTISQGSTVIAASSTEAAHGTYSMKITGDGTDNRVNADKAFTAISDTETYYFRWYVYIGSSQLQTTDKLRHMLFYDGAVQRCISDLDTDGSGDIVDIDLGCGTCGGTIISDTAITFNMDAWNWIEVAFKADGAVGGAQIWVNGSSIASNFTKDTSTCIGIDEIRLGNDAFGSGPVNGGVVYYDSVEVASSGPVGAAFTNVWKKTGVTTEPNLVFLDGTKGTDEGTCPGGINASNEWCWDANVLYVYSTSDADTAFTSPGIEASQRDNTFLVQNNYITIENLTVQHANEYSIKQGAATTNNIIIDSVVAEYNFGRGISFHQANEHDDGRITGCTARYNGEGISVNLNANTWQVDNNTAHNNDDFGIKFWASNNANQLAGLTIESNVAYSNGSDSNGVGIWIDEVNAPSTRNIIRYNLVYSNYADGIFIEKADNTDVYYNIVYDNATTAFRGNISVKASGAEQANDNHIYNNVSYGSNYWGLYCGVFDEGATPEVNDNEFKNNISIGSAEEELYAENGGGNDTTHGTGNIYTYNSFDAEAADFIYWDDANHATYDLWETAYGSGTNSVEADPLFYNAGSADFRINCDSPAISAGTSVSLTRDYANNFVPLLTEDVGAYESQCRIIIISEEEEGPK